MYTESGYTNTKERYRPVTRQSSVLASFLRPAELHFGPASCLACSLEIYPFLQDVAPEAIPAYFPYDRTTEGKCRHANIANATIREMKANKLKRTTHRMEVPRQSSVYNTLYVGSASTFARLHHLGIIFLFSVFVWRFLGIDTAPSEQRYFLIRSALACS